MSLLSMFENVWFKIKLVIVSLIVTMTGKRNKADGQHNNKQLRSIRLIQLQLPGSNAELVQRVGELLDVSEVFRQLGWSCPVEMARSLNELPSKLLAEFESESEDLIVVIVNAHGARPTGNLTDDITFPDDPVISSEDFFTGRKPGFAGIYNLLPEQLSRPVHIVAAQCYGAAFVEKFAPEAPSKCYVHGLSFGPTHSRSPISDYRDALHLDLAEYMRSLAETL